jgi:hypothetical protein
MSTNWTYIEGNWVLCPPHPCGVIHFLGGAFVASAPHLTYQNFLGMLAHRGYCIIATPFLVQPNHQAITTEVRQSFQLTYNTLKQNTPILDLPIFGVGHSLGSKLQLLLSCEATLPRAGNILISFNNASSDRAIPFANLIEPFIPLTFSPNPAETLALVKTRYQQAQTLILRFKTDTLDESHSLTPILKQKFPSTLMDQTLPGDHLTPLCPNLSAAFLTDSNTNHPLEQWLNHEVFANLSRLEQITVKWLDYQQQLYHRSQRR